MNGEVTGQRGACAGRGRDLSEQVLDTVLRDRGVELDQRPGHGDELVGSFGGESLACSAILVAAADEHSRGAATAGPAAVRAGLCGR